MASHPNEGEKNIAKMLIALGVTFASSVAMGIVSSVTHPELGPNYAAGTAIAPALLGLAETTRQLVIEFKHLNRESRETANIIYDSAFPTLPEDKH